MAAVRPAEQEALLSSPRLKRQLTRRENEAVRIAKANSEYYEGTDEYGRTATVKHCQELEFYDAAIVFPCTPPEGLRVESYTRPSQFDDMVPTHEILFDLGKLTRHVEEVEDDEKTHQKIPAWYFGERKPGQPANLKMVEVVKEIKEFAQQRGEYSGSGPFEGLKYESYVLFLRQMVVRVLLLLKLRVEQVYSNDGDQVLIKFYLSEHVAAQLADETEYQLQLARTACHENFSYVPDLEEAKALATAALALKRDDSDGKGIDFEELASSLYSAPPNQTEEQYKEWWKKKVAELRSKNEYVPPYLEYEVESEGVQRPDGSWQNTPTVAFCKKEGNALWARYDMLGRRIVDESLFNPISRIQPGVSLFRHTDIMRLGQEAIDSMISIEYLEVKGIVDGFVWLHQPIIQQELTTKWSNFSCSTIFSWNQPLKAVRDYFGEQIALYFAWTGHFAKWLLVPGIIGACLCIYAFIKDPQFRMQTMYTQVISIFYAGYILMWGVAFIESWKVKETDLAKRWGMENLHESSRPRPQFEGELFEHEETKKRGLEKLAITIRHAAKRILTVFITFNFVTAVLIAIVGIFSLRAFVKYHPYYVPSFLEGHVPLVASIANSITIVIFNVVWTGLAKAMVNFENHKFEADYVNSLVVKMFVFKFVNYYNSLIYTAFFKNSVDPCDPVEWDTCLPTLRQTFLTNFIVQTIAGLSEVGMPLLMYQLNKWKETRSKKDVDLSAAEKQTFKQQYEGTLEDYMELVVVFGYVTMFPIVFPLIALLAFFTTLIELRMDAVKMVRAYRRPFPFPAASIGAWNDILEAISNMAVIVNVALVVFDLKLFANTSMTVKLGIFIALEHFLLILRYAVTLYWRSGEKLFESEFDRMSRRMKAVAREAQWGADEEDSRIVNDPQERAKVFRKAKDHPRKPEGSSGLSSERENE